MSADVMMDLVKDSIVSVNGGKTAPQVAPLLHSSRTPVPSTYHSTPIRWQLLLTVSHQLECLLTSCEKHQNIFGGT